MNDTGETIYARREVIRELLKTEGPIDPYYFQERYLINPGRLAAAIRDLLSNSYLDLSDKGLQLTDKGRRWVYANRLEIFAGQEEKYWRKPLREVFGERLGIHDPYMPDSYAENKDFFDKLLRGGAGKPFAGHQTLVR